MSKPDHEPRTQCPQCGAVCTTKEWAGFFEFEHCKEPTIGTYTENEIVNVFKERNFYRDTLELIRDNPRFNNGVTASAIAKECLELNTQQED